VDIAPVPGLDYDIREGVAYLTINRPEKLNSLSPEMYAGLRTSVIRAELDEVVQLIVLRSTGDRAFCTGGDLVQGASDWTDDDLPRRLAEMDGIFPFTAFERCSKLIITGVNGLAQAAGLIAVLVSDLVIASELARFRVPETLRGLCDPYIPRRLPGAIGTAKARWMIYTADELDAREAERAGLVGKVVPHDELDAEIGRTVDKLRRTGPGSRTHYKRMLRDVLPPIGMDEMIASMTSSEALEGMRSFAEKRLPSWSSGNRTAPDGDDGSSSQ
jgi:enoyl-CoA hydratase